jgi:non-specific serine/threonine protein kinase/serine/threonine-protein kinase
MKESRKDRLKVVRERFESLSSVTPAERERTLREIGAKDPELKGELESLFKEADSAAAAFAKLDAEHLGPSIEDLRKEARVSETASAEKVVSEHDELPGEKIGSYVLDEIVGEGGFSAVWKARQEEPVRRVVALKFLKPGMDSKEIMTRFEGERQALAMMHHPNIANVLDAGTSKYGRPYFVMEYVEGEPLNTFCEQHRLSLDDRLRLFQQICSAVQHAHQQGVIHRDLKPGNILVQKGEGPGEGTAFPTIIDFGVAKAMSAPITDKPLVTRIGQIIGTPVYMSPEQVDLGAAGIDTRADIYSLGVMLYELATGFLPFNQETFKHAAMGEVQRLIREVEPPKPSTRLKTLQETGDAGLQKVLKSLQTDLPSLRRVLKSDLDWVILKCLEKDRSRRYSSAHGLALDIGRFLRNHPVDAGPPDQMYRISKYIKRHRAGVAAAFIVLVSLMLGLAGTTAGLIRANRAQAAEAEQRRSAEARAAELQQVTDYQRPIFERLEPEAIGSDIFRSITERYGELLEISGVEQDEARQRMAALEKDLYQVNPTDLARQTFNDVVLVRSSEAIGERFGEQPSVEAALRESLGQAFLQVGLPLQAEKEQARAVELYARWKGSLHQDTLKARKVLAEILLEEEDLARATSLLQRLLETVRAPGDFPPELLPGIQFLLGCVAYLDKNWEEAESYLVDSMRGFDSTLGSSHPDTLRAELERIHAMRHFDYRVGYNSLNISGEMAKIAPEQEPLFKTLLDKIVGTLGKDHSLTWKARHYYAECLALHTWLPVEENRHNAWSRDLFDRAREQLESVAKSQASVLGELHPVTLETRKILPFYYKVSTIGTTNTLGRRAVADLEEILQSELELWGENHPSIVGTLTRLGRFHHQFGFPDKFEEYYNRAIRIHKRLHPEPDTELADLYSSLADALLYYRSYPEALEAISNCLATAKEADVTAQRMQRYRILEARCLTATGHLREAETFWREIGWPSPLIVNLVLQGRWEDAVNVANNSLKTFIERTGSRHSFSLRWDYLKLGGYFWTRGYYDEALLYYEDAYACWQMTPADDPRAQGGVNGNIAAVLIKLGRFEEARPILEELEVKREEFFNISPQPRTGCEDFPFAEHNPYFAREATLLKAAAEWDAIGDNDKADDYLDQYFAFKKELAFNANPEWLQRYEIIVTGEYGAYSMREVAPFLAQRGHFEEAEWHFTRAHDRDIWRFWSDPEEKRHCYQQIISFYKQWHEADPKGRHLEKISRWEMEIAHIDKELAKWKR